MLPPPPKHDAPLDEWLAYLDELRKLPPGTLYLQETVEFVEGTIERMAKPPAGLKAARKPPPRRSPG